MFRSVVNLTSTRLRPVLPLSTMARLLALLLATTTSAAALQLTPTRRDALRSAAGVISAGVLVRGAASASAASSPVVFGTEELMAPKAHGTTDSPVQTQLRFNVSRLGTTDGRTFLFLSRF